jgi:hypothetical protein
MNRLIPIIALLALVGCIRAPDIVMTDRGTALEQQAGGSYQDLEKQLNRKAIEARPVPLTPKQFEELGIQPLPLKDQTQATDADRVDALLEQHCIGEGKDGLLVDTHGTCLGASDRAEAIELVDRVNQARQQLWRWMRDQKKDHSVSELQKSWQKAHVSGVVCGGWLEDDDGKWDAKKC